jgi:hypothetical protein
MFEILPYHGYPNLIPSSDIYDLSHYPIIREFPSTMHANLTSKYFQIQVRFLLIFPHILRRRLQYRCRPVNLWQRGVGINNLLYMREEVREPRARRRIHIRRRRPLDQGGDVQVRKREVRADEIFACGNVRVQRGEAA